MKKFATIICVVFFISCGGGSSEKTNDTTAPATTETKPEIKDPEVAKGLDLISKSDCFTCHKISEALVGPPYNAIANKYKTLTPVVMDSMVTQINKGGSGRWGIVKMPAHPAISRADAESMVHYIMSMKD